MITKGSYGELPHPPRPSAPELHEGSELRAERLPKPRTSDLGGEGYLSSNSLEEPNMMVIYVSGLIIILYKSLT